MLFFKLTVAAATIQSVLSCPAAKKTNLRSEGKYVLNSSSSSFNIDGIKPSCK